MYRYVTYCDIKNNKSLGTFFNYHNTTCTLFRGKTLLQTLFFKTKRQFTYVIYYVTLE